MACVRFGKCRPADLTALFRRPRGSGQAAARPAAVIVYSTSPEASGSASTSLKLDPAGNELMVKQRGAGPGSRSQVIQEVAFGRRQVHDRANAL